MSMVRKRGATERGAAAVEFAIIGSLLLMILFGTIQFGIAYHRYQGLNAAAREGARLGSLSTTTKDEIATRVKDSVSAIDTTAFVGTSPHACPGGTLSTNTACIDIQIRNSSGTLVAAADQPCNLQSGNTVVVETKFRMEIPIPLWASPTITVTGTGEFRCE